VPGPTYKPLVDREKIIQRIEKGRRAKWWRRVGSTGHGFHYTSAEGKRMTDEPSLERIRSLVIPPAWRLVRISPAPSSRIQALGVDTTGRVQYLYHPKFAERQQRKKYAKIERFGEYLPAIRHATNEHLSLEGFPREKVLALMVRLINQLYIRMGDEKSVRHYKTYGITTLQNRHLEIKRNGTLVFEFVGKSHIKHRKVLVDTELADIMAKLKELGPSRKLFHYHDDDGKPRAVKPADVNGYLKSLTSDEFSSKDLRTWGATLLAAVELAEIGRAETEAERKKNIVRAVKKVAEQLGNTPTVCRSSYIHPIVFKAYENDVILEDFRPRKTRRAKRTEVDYEPEESSLLKLFKAYGNGSK
jgi:DNA topoisomerase-1